MRGTIPRSPLLRAALLAVFALAAVAPRATALPPTSTPLTSLAVSAITGEKPQSKVWTYAGRWWCVMPSTSLGTGNSGSWVWRLDGTVWTNVLKLSSATSTFADVRAVGGVTHVLLFSGASSQLASIEYVGATQTYQAWTTRSANVPLSLDAGTETATIDVDSQGRMWLATDRAAGTDQVAVYYSDAPYSAWSASLTLATGTNADDICSVVALPGGKVGVMWSNQNTKRFGFRVHVDGADPAAWAADEVPASQSALNVGGGMADDHLHLVAGSDGTLYAAVKTSYDTGGYPKMALLVRRPAGTWDDLYPVDAAGTRPIVLLDETAATVTVPYTSSESGGNIVYREAPTAAIAFGAQSTLITGTLNNPMSTKQLIAGEVVVVAGTGSSLGGVLRSSGTGYTITATAGTGGSISPSGAVSVSSGGNQSFTITAITGYHVEDVLVDAVSAGAVTNYTFTNVTTNHTIAASFSPDVPGGDLVGRWPMDEGTGTVIHDATTYLNDGNLLGNPTWAAGVSGQALVLNGTDQYAQVPHSASLNLSTGLTLAAWIKPGKLGTQPLIAKETISPAVWGYALELSGVTPGRPFFRLDNNTSGSGRLDGVTAYPQDGNTWMHVAATYDGTWMRIYINGVLDNSLARSITVPANTLPVGIGAQSTGEAGRWYQGAIDDARIYNRALSASEIAALANVVVNAPPDAPVLAGPADHATGVALAPTLDVVVDDPDSPALTVSFYGRANTGIPGPDFTVVALPDAQNYTAQSGTAKNAMFKAQTQWCADSRASRNIRYVAQLGDLVNTASVPVEWMRADTTLKILEAAVTPELPYGIPFGVTIGNHDQNPYGSADNSTVEYNANFGTARFAGRGYYGGHFADNGDSWYELFSASGMDFIVVGLEYDTSPDANRLHWADSLLRVFPARRAIVLGHYLIEGNGNWAAQGQAVYDSLKDTPNLFLMMCGHTGDSGRRQDVYDGRTVHTLLTDYQSRANGGDGWLRYLEFSPANDVIRARTYSPWLGQYTVTADSSNQFTLPYSMSGSGPFQLIGTVTSVVPGAHATLPWSGVAASTQYEWYVTVSDGASTTTSAPTWTFTTAGGGAPPDPVTNLAATPLASGNGSGGMLQVKLAWTPPSQPGTAEVYRKAFGDYPRYRAGLGGEPAIPATPVAAVAAGWTLTGVTAPDQTDAPGARGYWYYVVFTSGTGGTSGASNRAAALDYLLGDVHNGLAPCSGDNQVSTPDLAYLGAHYGTSVGSDELLACLDVGPTSDGGLTSRPAPDGAIEFEDLVLFALRWGTRATAPAMLQPARAGTDAIALAVPAIPAPGSTFAVGLEFSGSGRIAGLSAQLDFDPAVVELMGVEPGGLLGRQGVPFAVLSSKPGNVDAVSLGGGGLAGSGELAQVRFRVKTAGETGIRLARVVARDAANRDVAVQGAGAVPPVVRTALRAAAPNPFRVSAALGFSLAQAGPVELSIYSVDGRLVRTLIRGERPAGEYQPVWDATNDHGERVRAGVYFARLTAGSLRFSRTLVLLD